MLGPNGNFRGQGITKPVLIYLQKVESRRRRRLGAPEVGVNEANAVTVQQFNPVKGDLSRG